MATLWTPVHKNTAKLLFFTFPDWNCVHTPATPEPLVKPKKMRTHITLAGPVLQALEALARIQGITLSDLVEDLGRAHLKEHNALPEITPQQIEEEIKRLSAKKGKGKPGK